MRKALQAAKIPNLEMFREFRLSFPLRRRKLHRKIFPQSPALYRATARGNMRSSRENRIKCHPEIRNPRVITFVRRPIYARALEVTNFRDKPTPATYLEIPQSFVSPLVEV